MLVSLAQGICKSLSHCCDLLATEGTEDGSALPTAGLRVIIQSRVGAIDMVQILQFLFVLSIRQGHRDDKKGPICPIRHFSVFVSLESLGVRHCWSFFMYTNAFSTGFL